MKKLICFVLSVLLVSASTVPALAAVATSSNSDDLSLDDYLSNYKKIPLPADNPGLGYVPDASVHTASDSDVWIGDDGFPVADSDDRMLSDDIMSFASLSNQIIVYARDSDNVLYTDWGSSNFQTFSFPKLESGKYYKNIEIYFKDDSLPDPGTYSIRVRCYDTLGNIRNAGVDNISADYFQMQDGGKVGGFYTAEPTSVDKNNRSWDAKCTLKINYDTNLVIYKMDLYRDVAIDEISFRVNNVSFQRDSTTTPALSSPNDNGSAQDHIANQSTQIAQNTAAMQDTLKEIVQTISKQLEALWNQQYNYIHLEDMANADKNADKIVNSISDNISDQMINDDANTDTIVNGYDGSGIDSDNNRLNNSINEYESAESAVLDKVNEELGNFEFQNSFQGYVNSIVVISSFLQRLYDNSGAFKDVINIGFFLSIASIVIGMYRFKEG